MSRRIGAKGIAQGRDLSGNWCDLSDGALPESLALSLFWRMPYLPAEYDAYRVVSPDGVLVALGYSA
jgi:hypothetical protein